MRAAVIKEPGAPEVFEIQEIEDPIAGPDEVLVSVAATALNRADLLQRLGRYSGPVGTRDDIPGLEMAGIVDEPAVGNAQAKRVITEKSDIFFQHFIPVWRQKSGLVCQSHYEIRFQIAHSKQII